MSVEKAGGLSIGERLENWLKNQITAEDVRVYFPKPQKIEELPADFTKRYGEVIKHS